MTVPRREKSSSHRHLLCVVVVEQKKTREKNKKRSSLMRKLRLKDHSLLRRVANGVSIAHTDAKDI